MYKINKTPPLKIEAIKRKTAMMLPDRPTLAGLKPDAIKLLLCGALVDGDTSLLGEISRIIDENNEVFEKISKALASLEKYDEKLGEKTTELSKYVPNTYIARIPTTSWEQASKDEPYTATVGEVGNHQHVTIWALDNITVEWLNVNRPTVSIINDEIILTAAAKPSKDLTLAMLTEPYATGEEDDKAYSIAELVGLTDEAVRLNLGKRMTSAETRLDSAEVIGGLVEIKASDWVNYGTTINLPIEADTLTLLWPDNEVSTTIAERQGIYFSQAFVDDEDDEVLLIRRAEEDYNGALRLRYIRLPMINAESQRAAVLLIGAKYSPNVGSGGGNGDVVIRPDPHVILTIAADSWSETTSIGLTTWITGATPLDEITPTTMIRLSAMDAETAADWSVNQTGAAITYDEETETYSLRVWIIGDKPTADWQILMETATVEETEGVTGPWVSVIPPVSDATDKVAVHNYDKAAHPGLQSSLSTLSKGLSDTNKALELRLKSADLPAKLDEYRAAKGLIDKTVSDLVNYYAKNQTLTKDEINALVSAIPKFKIEVVTSLPTSNISETTVYLVKSGDDDSNLYTEYIRTGEKWEKLGTQTVDLTGYATEAWVNDILAAYVKTVDMEAYVAGLLDAYITKDVADKTYQPAGDYPNTAEMETAISNATKNLAPQSSIPTKVSQLSNDSDYLTTTTGDKRYAKPSDIPTVPTKLPNPDALTINGTKYDGSTAVNITITSDTDGSVEIFLNDEDIAIVGHEYNLYHYAVVHGKKQYTDYDIAVTLTYINEEGKTVYQAAKNYAECFRFTPTVARDYSLTYLVRGLKNEYIAQKTITLHVIEDTAVSGKKVLFIGDSFTDAGIWPAEIQHNLSGGGIISIGTVSDTVTIGGQSLSVLHEGRQGWATWDYAGTNANFMSKFPTASNVFRNPSTNKFDLSHYMETYHPGVTLNAVCVFLGTNGLGAVDSTSAGMTELITRIREYDATIPILLHYTLQNVGQDYWSKFADQKNNTKWYRQHLWREQYERYKSLYRGMDNVYIVPVYENLDYEMDFPHKEFAASARNPATISRVTDGHPSKEGYLKMADVYYAYLLKYMREGGEVEEPDEPEEPDVPTVVNLVNPSTANDANPDTTTPFKDEWVNGYYISYSGGLSLSAKAGTIVTDLIPVKYGQKLDISGVSLSTSEEKNRFRWMAFKADGSTCYSSYLTPSSSTGEGAGSIATNDDATGGIVDTSLWNADVFSDLAYVRFSCFPAGSNDELIVTLIE